MDESERCKATIDCYPATRCSRRATVGDYCKQHDPVARNEKNRRKRLRRQWLYDLREARLDVGNAQRLVCDVAKELYQKDQPPCSSEGEALWNAVRDLLEMEDRVSRLKKQEVRDEE